MGLSIDFKVFIYLQYSVYTVVKMPRDLRSQNFPKRMVALITACDAIFQSTPGLFGWTLTVLDLEALCDEKFVILVENQLKLDLFQCLQNN